MYVCIYKYIYTYMYDDIASCMFTYKQSAKKISLKTIS